MLCASIFLKIILLMSFISRHFFINNLIDLYRCYFYQHNATNAWSFTTDLIDFISKRQCSHQRTVGLVILKVTLHAHMHVNGRFTSKPARPFKPSSLINYMEDTSCFSRFFKAFSHFRKKNHNRKNNFSKLWTLISNL